MIVYNHPSKNLILNDSWGYNTIEFYQTYQQCEQRPEREVDCDYHNIRIALPNLFRGLQ